jgi:hypothetical protein
MHDEIFNPEGELPRINIEKYLEESDFKTWHDVGIENGWVSEVFCDMHEGGPVTDEEGEAIDREEMPCLPHMRVWYK